MNAGDGGPRREVDRPSVRARRAIASSADRSMPRWNGLPDTRGGRARKLATACQIRSRNLVAARATRRSSIVRIAAPSRIATTCIASMYASFEADAAGSCTWCACAAAGSPREAASAYDTWVAAWAPAIATMSSGVDLGRTHRRAHVHDANSAESVSSTTTATIDVAGCANSGTPAATAANAVARPGPRRARVAHRCCEGSICHTR